MLNVPKEPTTFDFVIEHQSLLLNDYNFVIKERIFAQKKVIIFSTYKRMCIFKPSKLLVDGWNVQDHPNNIPATIYDKQFSAQHR